MDVRLSTLEAEVRILKEKFSLSEGILLKLPNHSNRIHNFDDELAKSEVFQNFLKAVDSNAIANDQKLLDHSLAQFQSLKFALGDLKRETQDLIAARDHRLNALAEQVRSQNSTLAGVQEWIRIKSLQSQSPISVETLKIGAQGTRTVLESIKTQLSSVKEQLNTSVDLLSQRIDAVQGQSKLTFQSCQNQNQKLKGQFESQLAKQLERTSMGWKEQFKVLTQHLNSLNSHVSRIDQSISVNEMENPIEVRHSQKQQRKGKTNKDLEKQPNSTKLCLKSDNQQYNHAKDYLNQKEYHLDKKNPHQSIRLSAADPVLPFQETSYRNPEPSLQESLYPSVNRDQIETEPFGIKGLLNRSKPKKQKKPLPAKKNLLQPAPNRVPLHRQQPPAPLLNPYRVEEPVFEQDEVCAVDEEGFLMDSQGVYLVDANGEKIQLNQQQMEQLLAGQMPP